MITGGIVLAGGRSKRMGRPKASLEWHGSTLLRHVTDIVVGAVNGPVVVVRAPGQELPALPPEVRVVEDPREGLGPLQGIAAGLRALADAGAGAAFVSAVDVPFLQPAFVRAVAGALDGDPDVEIALPHVGGRRQPLAAAYRTALAPRAAELVAAGELRPAALLDRSRVAVLDEAALPAAAASVRNLNTPGEYEAARAAGYEEGVMDPRMVAVVERDGERDEVAVEEPLEIRVDGEPLTVTMRTPGNDEELALGFLHGEGLIDGPRAAGLTDDFAANTVEVAGPLLRDPGARRFYTTSSCGVCGRGSLEEVAVHAPPLAAGPVVARDLLAALPDRLRQPAFARTGGLHATGLFDAGGELLILREDVGRHNAMDKVIGRALLDGGVPLRDRILCVSGRLSFELVQKAAVAGAPILVGVGAPTSLAVDLARDRGLTLAGFARRGRVNVYAAPERVR